MAQPPQPQQEFSEQKLYLWIKGLESKVNTLLRELDVFKNDFSNKYNRLKKDFTVLNDDLLQMKHDIDQNQQKMDLIIKEFKQTAGKEEVMTIQKYIDLWNPMNFVTQRDLERALKGKK